MPVAEIIDEIDAYILTLRMARDLLLAPLTEVRRERSREPKKKIEVSAKVPGPSSPPRIKKRESRSLRPKSEPKVANTAVPSVAELPAVVAPQIPKLEQPPVPAVTRIPARKTSQIRRVPRRITKPAIGAKTDAIKPATALAGLKDSKIVVVSAEQVRRERERTARPAVLRPRIPASGLSGKLAFEALFRDETDPSKNSGQ